MSRQKKLLDWLDHEIARYEKTPTYEDSEYYRNSGAQYALEEARDELRNLFNL